MPDSAVRGDLLRSTHLGRVFLAYEDIHTCSEDDPASRFLKRLISDTVPNIEIRSLKKLSEEERVG